MNLKKSPKEEKIHKEDKSPIDNLVYKSFVKRFNEKYKNQLSENQKVILTLPIRIRHGYAICLQYELGRC